MELLDGLARRMPNPKAIQAISEISDDVLLDFKLRQRARDYLAKKLKPG
jgi:hypothetical protein